MTWSLIEFDSFTLV